MPCCTSCGRDTPSLAIGCPECGAQARAFDTDSPTRAGDDLATAAAGEGPPIRASDALAPGAFFANRYRIIRRLGVGGMGAVYQAWDEDLQIAVALKVIRRGVAGASAAAARDLEERFKRELLLARLVTHRNVVRIYDIGEFDHVKYITMSYVHGADLQTLLSSRTRLGTGRSLVLGRQIAAGLAAAHEAGVVHRDLKPGNIMVSERNEALIMDFGLARSVSPLAPGMKRGDDPHLEATHAYEAAQSLGHTAYGTVMGTPRYMAPEQARGGDVDERADVYAFGLILREMLIGLDDPAAGGVIGAPPDAEQRLRSPREIEASIPEPLDTLVSRCLEPDPNLRYPSAAEVVSALNLLDAGGKRLPRYRTLGPRSLAAVVVLVVGLVAGSWEIARRVFAPTEAPGPVPVLVADFENLSRDKMPPGAVEQAMAIALGHSSFIDAYSRTAARETADRISPGSGLTPAMARLVAQREGVKVIVAGEVRDEGAGYRVSARALDTTPGSEDTKPIIRVSRRAAGREAILGVVNELAVAIRDSLGDLEAGDSPAAETFTAGSLQAMSAYAKAQDLNYQGRQQEALEAYREALSLDPGLGRAHAGMGAAYHGLGRPAEAETSYREALKHLDRMTEREKYRTLGGYYLGVARNYEKAIENFETLVRLYPADNAGHANLALASLYTHDLDRAVAEGRRAIEIYPGNVLQRVNYAMYCMYAGQFDTAVSEANKVLAQVTDDYALLTLALASVGLGDLEASRTAYRRLEAASDFGSSVASLGLADIEMFGGRPRAAVSILDPAITRDRRDTRGGNLAHKLVALGEARLALGEPSQAARAAQDAVDQSPHESVLYPAARVLLRAGRRTEVAGIVRRLQGQLQNQTRAFAGLLEGETALNDGRIPEAIEALRESVRRNDTWFGRYLLGRAYLEAGHGAEALAELEVCQKRRGETSDVFFADSPTVRYFPPLLYWLGRAQEQVGARDSALECYRRFLKLRLDADSPDPLVQDASRRAVPPA